MNYKWSLLTFLFCLPLFSHAENRCNQIAASTNSLTNSDSIKVMTANLAHGRATNFSQLTTSTYEIKQNLNAISSFIQLKKPHILALQELDAPSWWSGNFNHASHIMRHSQFNSYTVTNHVNAWWGTYGTGLFSTLAMKNCSGVTFKPSFPTTNKGFSYGEILLEPDISVGIVSLHLDFFRASVRSKQIEELKLHLNQNNKPLIIMGDFNTDWRWQDSVIKTLQGKYRLKLFKPNSKSLDTFGIKRLDWIMVSEHFSFKHYENVGNGLSDHMFVMAEVIYETN